MFFFFQYLCPVLIIIIKLTDSQQLPPSDYKLTSFSCLSKPFREMLQNSAAHSVCIVDFASDVDKLLTVNADVIMLPSITRPNRR